MDHKTHDHSHGHQHDHDHSIYGELIHHFPYAVFSVAIGLAVLSFISIAQESPAAFEKTANILFHSFHFMHIVFAGTGVLITYLRFSSDVVSALLVGIVSPAIFCTLSDAVLPYIGGEMLGVHMRWHLCFLSELHNVIPFLLVGVLNGFVMGQHQKEKQSFYSLFSHFMHILVSALASLFYLVSHGFTDWYNSIGIVFLFLILAVVVPCTFSDVIVPMLFVKLTKKK